jgi:hypothetical protein
MNGGVARRPILCLVTDRRRACAGADLQAGTAALAEQAHHAAEAGIDGVSELWFDDQAAFEAAYASGIGATVAADSLAHVSGRVRVFVTEHDLGVSGHPD